MFSGYKFGVPDFDAPASTTTHGLAKCLTSTHDIPDCVASDQGASLAGKELQCSAHAEGMNRSDGILSLRSSWSA